MKAAKVALLTVIALVLFAALGVYSGVFNFAADDPHWGITKRLIESARERSIASNADEMKVSVNLKDAKLIASGAGEYAEMCTGCHLAPGMKDTETRVGLNPRPPSFAEPGAQRAPAQQFWIIKHGLKMTGMPAWGMTHDDKRIWSMVAFLQALPGLTPDAYRELVEAGAGGHHHHDEMGDEGHGENDDTAEAHEHSGAPPAHEHAPGTPEHEHKTDVGKLSASASAAAATVDRFQSLLAKGDTQGAAGLLDPAVLIYESGEAEKSRAEYASHHLQADAEFLKGARVRTISRTGDAVGDLAWIATDSELTVQGAKPMVVITTETMLLKRAQGSWRIAHIHWSSHKKS